VASRKVKRRIAQYITMSGMKDLVGKTAQTNYYQVSFSTLKDEITDHLKQYSGIRDVNGFLSRKAGLLCSDASLPTSSFATGEVKDNFMGINQEFAHTRIYTDLDFTFYVDTDYNAIRIFEGWMDYISGGAIEDQQRQFSSNYYRRFQYPDSYKVQTMYITKFEKNYSPEPPHAPGSQIDYQFINAFPKTITSIPVSYGPADLLKVTVSFNYDRYIIDPTGTYTQSNTDVFTDFPRNTGPYMGKKSVPEPIRTVNMASKPGEESKPLIVNGENVFDRTTPSTGPRKTVGNRFGDTRPQKKSSKRNVNGWWNLWGRI